MTSEFWLLQSERPAYHDRAVEVCATCPVKPARIQKTSPKKAIGRRKRGAQSFKLLNLY